jgi:hypothetical protein
LFLAVASSSQNTYLLAVLGFLGVLLGALIAAISGVLLARQRERADLLQWLRDNRRSAYTEFLGACNRATLLGRQSVHNLRHDLEPIAAEQVYEELQLASACQETVTIIGGPDTVAASRELLQGVFNFVQRALTVVDSRFDYAAAARVLSRQREPNSSCRSWAKRHH